VVLLRVLLLVADVRRPEGGVVVVRSTPILIVLVVFAAAVAGATTTAAATTGGRDDAKPAKPVGTRIALPSMAVCGPSGPHDAAAVLINDPCLSNYNRKMLGRLGLAGCFDPMFAVCAVVAHCQRRPAGPSRQAPAHIPTKYAAALAASHRERRRMTCRTDRLKRFVAEHELAVT